MKATAAPAAQALYHRDLALWSANTRFIAASAELLAQDVNYRGNPPSRHDVAWVIGSGDRHSL